MSALDSLYQDLNRVNHEIQSTKELKRLASDRSSRDSYQTQLDNLYEYKRHIQERIRAIKEELRSSKNRY